MKDIIHDLAMTFLWNIICDLYISIEGIQTYLGRFIWNFLLNIYYKSLKFTVIKKVNPKSATV